MQRVLDGPATVPRRRERATRGLPLRADWPPSSVIYTGPNEPNLRVVDVLETESDDPEMHFTVLVVEPT